MTHDSYECAPLPGWEAKLTLVQVLREPCAEVQAVASCQLVQDAHSNVVDRQAA